MGFAGMEKTRIPVTSVVLWVVSVVVAGTGRTDADHVSSCTQIDPNGDVHSADLAMDGNEATCARTCFQRGAWLRVKINTNAGEYVRNVTIRGYLPLYSQIRIGNGYSDVGFRDGFFNNAVCVSQTEAPTSDVPGEVTSTTFQCDVPRAGSIVSFRAGNTGTTPQLTLCEVTYESV